MRTCLYVLCVPIMFINPYSDAHFIENIIIKVYEFRNNTEEFTKTFGNDKIKYIIIKGNRLDILFEREIVDDTFNVDLDIKKRTYNKQEYIEFFPIEGEEWRELSDNRVENLRWVTPFENMFENNITFERIKSKGDRFLLETLKTTLKREK